MTYRIVPCCKLQKDGRDSRCTGWGVCIRNARNDASFPLSLKDLLPRKLPVVLAALALSGCATQYDRFRHVPLEGATRAQVVDRLEALEIPFSFATCEQASATAVRPAEGCHRKESVGIIRATANNGHHLMGIGAHWVQLHIELGADDSVVAVREEPVKTLF